MPGIGLLNEKELHASLKQWYARPGDRFEIPVDGFVIDIVRDDLLIEIDLASRMNTRRDLAQKVAYCLREARIIELIGKRGRANLYRVSLSNQTICLHNNDAEAKPLDSTCV